MKIKKYLDLSRFKVILNNDELKSIKMLIPLVIISGFIEIISLMILPVVLKAFLSGEITHSDINFYDYLTSKIAEYKIISLSVLLCIFIIRTIYILFINFKINRFAFSIQARLERDVFSAYLKENFAFSQKISYSDKLKNITKEIQEFIVYSLMPYLQLISEIIILLLVLSFMIFFYTYLTIAVLLFMGLFGLLINKVINKKINEEGKNRQIYESLRYSNLQQAFGGLREIKLYSLEEKFLDSYRSVIDAYTKSYSKIFFYVQSPRVLLDLFLVILLVILLVATLSTNQSLENSFISIAVFGFFAMRVLPSVNKILVSIQNIDYSYPTVKVLRAILPESDALIDEFNNAQYPEPNNHSHTSRSKLIIADISYVFEDTSLLFADISGSISSGEILLVDGPSGSGKSTFADILSGLLEPTSGAFYLTSPNQNSSFLSPLMKLDRIRLTSYVSQNAFIFDGTLGQNISLKFDPPNSDSELIIDDLIARVGLTDCFGNILAASTRLGVNGIELSGGQRRRLGIARALFKNTNIILLDEVTAGLDKKSELEIIKLINSLKLLNIIVIIFTHSDEMKSICDNKISLLK